MTKVIAIWIGSLLIGTGINGFLIPHHLLDGGLVGIALILHYYFETQTGLCIFLLSLPLCIYAFFQEKSYFLSSFHGLVVSSFFIDWLSPLQSLFPLPIYLSSIIGGIVIGIGIGLMLHYETSTAGTDLLAHILSKATTINIGLIILIIDGSVVLLGYKTLGGASFIFSALIIFMEGMVTSLILRNHYRSYIYWRRWI